MSRTYEEIVAAIPPAAYAQRGRFASKLTFQQRCEILALYRIGIGRTLLAEAYGIDRRTITHIQNPKSPHYKSVRDEMKRLGAEEFKRTFITEDALAKIELLKIVEITKEQESRSTALKSANQMRGVHTVRNEYCSMPHRVVVEWRTDGDLGPGWYYQDLDGALPDQWLNNGDESIQTSSKCFSAALEVVSD